MAKRCSLKMRNKGIAMLMAGETCTVVAQTLNVSICTVGRWRRKLPVQQLQVVEQSALVKRDNDITELIEKYLRALLETGTAILQAVQDREYLHRQTAGHVAILFGVLTDKMFRLLEARQVAESIPAAIVETLSDGELDKIIADSLSRQGFKPGATKEAFN